MKIITWNVNSIKMRQGYLLNLINEVQPDVILLQELKCESNNFPYLIFESCGYSCHTVCQKSYNGVAVLTRLSCVVINKRLPGYDIEEARYIEVVVADALRIIGAYAPLGSDENKFVHKMRFLRAMEQHLKGMLDERVVVGGDFNVAVGPLDIYIPLPDSSCYAQPARNLMRSMMSAGYYDPYRSLYPSSTAFSWWDYRKRCFENNLGMRLDYFLVSPRVMDILGGCEIMTRYRAMEGASDHAPVMLSLKMRW